MAKNATPSRRLDVHASVPASLSDRGPAEVSRFGLPHALVIVACVVTAAVLAVLGMNVQAVLTLIGGAAAIGAAVVVAVATNSRFGGLGRFLRAYLNSSN